MKKLIFTVFLLSIVSTANAQNVITKNIGDFTELKVFDRVEVELLKGSENKVEISGISRDQVVIIVKQEILKIRMSLSNTLSGNDVKVKVFYKDINKLDVNEGAKITVKEVIKVSELDVRAQEGGVIFAEIEADRLFAKAVSGGTLNIEGNSKEQKVIVQAGGQYLGEKLKTNNTEVKISAGGKANIYAKDYVEANTAAGGTISIYGKPKETDEKKILGGKIIYVN